VSLDKNMHLGNTYLCSLNVLKQDIAGGETMNLRQKIGQMIVAGFSGKQVTDDIKKHIVKNNIGNIILFAENLGDAEEIYKLTADLQNIITNNTNIPPIIATDQEGGMVTRIFNGGTIFPGAMALSAVGDPENAYIQGKYMGEELSALGINCNLAPVLDINSNAKNPVIGVRSFGDTPHKVSLYANKFIKGLKESGIIATGKHFPGHGDTEVDSHFGLPCVEKGIDEMFEFELKPFISAIDNGIDAIMTSHVVFPAVDSRRIPSTISKKVLTDLLRNKLHFDGLIITDGMEMKAIADNFGIAKSAVCAINAGADLVCICHSIEEQEKAIYEITEAVNKGEILENRIDESVERILYYKKKYNLDKGVNKGALCLSSVTLKKHRDFARETSINSVTVVKNNENILPISGTDTLVISQRPVVINDADNGFGGYHSFAEYFSKQTGADFEVMDIEPDEDEVKKLCTIANKYKTIVVTTYNANLYKRQLYAVSEIIKSNENTVLVALRNPYDISHFDKAKAIICTYEYTKLSMESLYLTLIGQGSPNSKLPVKI